MRRHDSLWPDNIDTAHTLTICAACGVSDVYQLITDRRNIKAVVVNGCTYSHQEIRNMPLNGRVGDSQAHTGRVVDEPDPIRTGDGPVLDYGILHTTERMVDPFGDPLTAQPIQPYPTLAQVIGLEQQRRQHLIDQQRNPIDPIMDFYGHP